MQFSVYYVLDPGNMTDWLNDWMNESVNELMNRFFKSNNSLGCIQTKGGWGRDNAKYCDYICLPAKYKALTCEGWSTSWNTITEPSWPSKDVGQPHSLSWVPAEINLVINLDFSIVPPQEADDNIPPNDVRWGVMGVENGGSGIWDGGGVVVLCPAEPIQQEVNG